MKLNFKILKHRYETYDFTCEYVNEDENYIYYKNSKFGFSKISKKKKNLITIKTARELSYLAVIETPKKDRDIKRKKRQLKIKWQKIINKKPSILKSEWILEKTKIHGVELVAIIINRMHCYTGITAYLMVEELKYTKKNKTPIIYYEWYSQGHHIGNIPLINKDFV